MDKCAEKQALIKVFGSYAEKAEESESPDFVIRNNSYSHGIEITEFYPTDIDAKLQNAPSYTVGLLDETQQLHRKDRGILRVENVTVTHQDGTSVGDVRAIIQRNPTPVEKFDLLIKTIRNKSSKCKSYLERCNVVDLVIWDRSPLFGSESETQQLSANFAENRGFLALAPFRELFILSRSFDPPNHFYYPVRGNLFLVDALLLDHAYLESGGETSDGQRLPLLVHCLNELGHKACYQAPPNESIHVPGWQLLLDGLNLTLRNWTNHGEVQPLPETNSQPYPVERETVVNIVSKRFAMHCTNIVAMSAYET